MSLVKRIAYPAEQKMDLLEFHEIDGQLFAFGMSWRKVEPTHVDVRVCEATRVQYRDGTTGIEYAKRGEIHSGPETPNFNDAQRLFAVCVKWDNCAHWEFGEEEFDESRNDWSRGDGYIHTCHDNLDLLKAARLAYDRAKQVMVDAGTWDA